MNLIIYSYSRKYVRVRIASKKGFLSLYLALKTCWYFCVFSFKELIVIGKSKKHKARFLIIVGVFNIDPGCSYWT